MTDEKFPCICELRKSGLATEVFLPMKGYKTEQPMGVRAGNPVPPPHVHEAMVDPGGMGETKADDTGHVHKVRNWVALYSGVGPHIHKVPHGAAPSEAPQKPAEKPTETPKPA
jgi:hypothetical protein